MGEIGVRNPTYNFVLFTMVNATLWFTLAGKYINLTSHAIVEEFAEYMAFGTPQLPRGREKNKICIQGIGLFYFTMLFT